MSLLQIRSQDVSTGTQNNGAWNLSGNTTVGAYTLIGCHISPGDIPWMWTGIDSLSISDDNGSSSTINLASATGILKSNDESAAIAALIDAELTAWGGNWAGISSVVTRTDNGYTIEIDADPGAPEVGLNITWSTSDARFVFNKESAGVEQTTGNSDPITITSAHVENRPAFLLCTITEATNIQFIGTHTSNTTFLLSTNTPAELIPYQYCVFRNVHNKLNITVRREDYDRFQGANEMPNDAVWWDLVLSHRLA